MRGEWAEKTAQEIRRIGGRTAPRDRLSETERRIVELVVAGRKNREVADQLFLSPDTVAWNLSRVYRKLGVTSRTQLAVKVAESRLKQGQGDLASGSGIPRGKSTRTGGCSSRPDARAWSACRPTSWSATCRGVTAPGSRRPSQRLPHNEDVRYLGSLYVPTDEACLCRFEAADAQSVRDVNVLASLPFARIVAVTELGTTGSGHHQGRETA